jgi:hypothetical protein
MAAPTFTTDLLDFDLAENTGAWGEFVGMIAGGAPDEADAENKIQGSYMTSQSTNTTSLCSMGVIKGSPVTLDAGYVFLMWHQHTSPGALAAYSGGGLRAVVATDLTNWKAWATGGSDVMPNPYGGWQNIAFDPTLTTEYSNGTPPTTNYYGVGGACILTAAIAKGQPHQVDAIRYGRAQARLSGGESANYGTFAGFAAINDATSARWGLIQATTGGYLWKGLLSLGFSTKTTTFRARTTNVATLTTSAAHGFVVGDTVVITGVGGTGYNATAVITVVGSTTTFSYANTGSNEGSTADTGGLINGVVDFRDSNKSILIQDTRKVSSGFNKIEISNAGSRVDWTGISFSCLSPSTTASRGDLAVVDNADVNLESCNFTDMATFTFQSNSTINSTTFRRCNLITQSGAAFTGCTFDSTNDSAKALLVDNPAGVTDCAFVSGGTKHGVQFTTQGTYAWSGNIFTSYASSDGSSGNEAVYNNCTPYNTTQTYASSNQDSTLSLRSDAGGTSATGESFASTATKILSVARFYLKKSGTPTGNATAKIYAVTGTPNVNSTPTGAALATSENFNVANLTGSYAMVEFQFKLTNCITLTSGTNYFVVLDVSATTSSSGNTIDVGYDNSSPSFTAGNAATYAVGGSWSSQSYDLVFDCYTDGAIILNLSGGGSTPSIRNALGCSTSISASVDISVYVVDENNNPINDAQVGLYRTSDDLEIINKDTGFGAEADGYTTTSYNGSTPADIYLRVRKSSTGSIRYIPVSTTGTILSDTGYSTTITLVEDINA